MVDSAPGTPFGWTKLRTYHRFLPDLGPAEKADLARARQLEANIRLPSDEQCSRSSIGKAFGIYRIRFDPASHWTDAYPDSPTILPTLSVDAPE